MANYYKIIGADVLEYGPVSAEQFRQWIAEHRVDAQPKCQSEGAAECPHHYQHRRLPGLFRQMNTWAHTMTAALAPGGATRVKSIKLMRVAPPAGLKC